MDIIERVRRLFSDIDAAARAAGRTGSDIALVAASKTNPPERVREAILAGIRHVGENRVQELTEKNAALAYEGARLHFIGHLQKNKVQKVVGIASLIQSADSAELIRAIAAQAARLGITQDVLLEVNIGAEATKHGFSKDELPPVLGEVGVLEGVCVRGLMTIPPISEKMGGNRIHFAAMRELFVDISTKKYDNVSMDWLSMGMSGDFTDAILEGANMVRVGTAIFGAR